MFRWKTRSMECRLSIGLSQVRRGFYSRAGVIDVQKEWVTINSRILSFLWFFEGCNGEDLTPHLITRFRFFSDADKKLYDQTFKKCDEDMDGYVNGTEIKGVFLQVNLWANLSKRVLLLYSIFLSIALPYSGGQINRNDLLINISLLPVSEI